MLLSVNFLLFSSFLLLLPACKGGHLDERRKEVTALSTCRTPRWWWRRWKRGVNTKKSSSRRRLLPHLQPHSSHLSLRRPPFHLAIYPLASFYKEKQQQLHVFFGHPSNTAWKLWFSNFLVLFFHFKTHHLVLRLSLHSLPSSLSSSSSSTKEISPERRIAEVWEVSPPSRVCASSLSSNLVFILTSHTNNWIRLLKR